MTVLLGRVKNGQIQVQRFFKKDLLALEGKEIKIEKVQGGKTQQQLGYYWGCVLKIISDYTGFTPEECNQEFYRKFSTYEKVHKGKIYKFTKGLSGMSLGEAAQYITKVINYARQDLGLIIPDPDPEFIYEE